MPVKHLLLYESFNQVVTIKRKPSKTLYDLYNIIVGKQIVGTIEFYSEGNNINLSSIVIKEKFRSKGYGVKALRQFVFEISYGYIKPNYIFAECVSKHSLRTFVNAWGVPEYMGDVYDEYTDIEEALIKLPDYASLDADGTINGSGAIEVRYELNAAIRQARG